MEKVLARLLFAAFVSIPQFFLQAQQLTKADWREDIIQLRKLLETKHIDLYHATPKRVFDREFQKTLDRLGELDDDQIILEIA